MNTALTPASVIADAAALADEIGFEAVTLTAVARRLGVQTPSLYSHVRDRAALQDGITALALGDLAGRIAQAIAGRSGKAALEGFANAHRSLAVERPGLWQSLHRRAGAAAVAAPAARDLVALNDAVLHGYGIAADNRVHVIRFIGSTITGFLSLEQIGNFDHSQPPPAESWAAAIEALDILLTSRSTTA
jgi:AcrR family transcriptional regulator